MQRLTKVVVAASVLACGLAMAPKPGLAQSNYYQNGPTTTGDPWLNENNYDYNRQHMTPPNNQPQTYNNNDYDRYGNRGYDRNDDQYRYQSRQYDYGQNRSYDPRNYDQRDYGYQRPYSDRQGYSQYRSYNDDDE